jgi:4-hydroxythreonine-4-phosphate dehydrogenase
MQLLQARAKELDLPVELRSVDPAKPQPHSPGQLQVWHTVGCASLESGRLNPENSRYVIGTIAEATRACVDGIYDAMVTAPVHKGVINDAGIAFTGHTEFIAELTGGTPVMLLAIPGLRVALATTHLALRDVSRAIGRESLVATLRVLHRELSSSFDIGHPRILVCGLNPHAGEGGHLGREEIEVIEPAVKEVSAEGIAVEGPLPADTVFLPKNLERADAVLAMYHDQGLPVLKYTGFGRAVNITLGLPILRTSVDHGTALDLAGTGRADAGSIVAAIECAIGIAQTRRFHARPCFQRQ